MNNHPFCNPLDEPNNEQWAGLWLIPALTGPGECEARRLIYAGDPLPQCHVITAPDLVTLRATLKRMGRFPISGPVENFGNVEIWL